jgi:hypothetical protein
MPADTEMHHAMDAPRQDNNLKRVATEVKDSVIAKSQQASYPPQCKRLVFSHEYLYASYPKHVTLVDTTCANDKGRRSAPTVYPMLLYGVGNE